MPKLPNERHELYCMHRARGMVPRKAAVAAGFAVGSSTYTELEQDADIISRISELGQEIILRREQERAVALEAAKTVGQITGLSKAWVLQQLAETAVNARTDGEHAAAISALKLIGDEFGMFKGGSAQSDDGTESSNRTIDLDKTKALLDTATNVLLPAQPEPEKPPIDMGLVEQLIKTNKPVNPKDRRLSTGSETDVALTDAVELDEPDNS